MAQSQLEHQILELELMNMFFCGFTLTKLRGATFCTHSWALLGLGPAPKVPGHFLTLIPAFLIDLMIGQGTLGCQSPEPSREECWGNTVKIGRRVVARIVVRLSYDIA